MVALAEVRRWDPAGVEAAFTELGTLRDRLLEHEDELTATRPPAGWIGQAADAARAAQVPLDERLRRLTAAIAALRPAVADAVDTVTSIRRELDAADHLAATRGFTIAIDGTVHDARHTVVPAAAAQAHTEGRITERDEILALLTAVLARAEALDTTLTDLWTRAAAEQIDDGTGLTLADAEATGALAPPGAEAPPTEVAAWWAGLTPAQQEQVRTAHPGWVGNLDGIPAGVRDSANRALLPAEAARIETELAAATARLDAHGPPRPTTIGLAVIGDHTHQQLGENVLRLHRQQAALDAVTRTTATPERHLLLLDLAGHDQPRAAVAIGDVSTAEHVAVFTPGYTTTVADSLENYTRDMDALNRTAQEQLVAVGRGGETVAAVAWLGYDAPQENAELSPDSVALAGPAQDGGRELAGFLHGVDAAHTGDPHLTALGHSYGSTTTGYALHDAPVDDAVLFGSPGPSTTDITDLQVPPGHLGVLEAGEDPTADLGRFGTDTNQLDGATNLSAREQIGPDGAPLRESVGHSDYLTPGTTSQHNIAATVAGVPEHLLAGDNTDYGDWLRNEWLTNPVLPPWRSLP